MMATIRKSSVQVRLDKTLKRDAEAVFENLGGDAATAIRMFLKKVDMPSSTFSLRVRITRCIDDMKSIVEGRVVSCEY